MPRTRYDVEEAELRRERVRTEEPPAEESPELRGDVDRVLRSLASAPADVRGRQLGRLQRTGGNAAIARAIAERAAAEAPKGPAGPMETRSETLSHTFTAVIPRGKTTDDSSPGPALPAGAMSDAIVGHEHGTTPEQAAAAVGAEPDAATATAAPAPAPAEAAKGGEVAEGEAPAPGAEAAEPANMPPVSLPAIPLKGAAELTLCDALWPWLGYTGLVSQAGAAPGPNEFGVTRPGNMILKDITVWRVLGQFFVKATLEQKLDWMVRTGLGPTGEQNVSSALDPVITKANYAAVAADLTPNMGDLGGRPPRTNYWAQDLTEQHEKYHADDAAGRGPAAVGIASSWLGTKQAADVPGVNTLLQKVPGRAFTALMAAMGMPAREERAYGDGAGAYSRRALAIKALGAVGWYS